MTTNLMNKCRQQEYRCLKDNRTAKLGEKQTKAFLRNFAFKSFTVDAMFNAIFDLLKLGLKLGVIFLKERKKLKIYAKLKVFIN
jgi:hypothetical protein